MPCIRGTRVSYALIISALLAGCLPVLLTPTRPLDSLLREGRPRPVSSLLAALFHARATRGASLWALFDVFVDSGLAITRDVATGTSAPERRRVPDKRQIGVARCFLDQLQARRQVVGMIRAKPQPGGFLARRQHKTAE